ncbi:MAG: YceI family protein [Candidatus Peribacteraceae bacterium]|nr:YceI family protein [Candidatus Peribacteraceae bacterium]
MKKFVTPFLLVAALSLGACQTSSLNEDEMAPVPESDTAFSGELRQIDKSKSVISFVGKSDVINHEGKFNEYSATVTLDEETPADLEKATIAAEIDITSVVIDAAGLQDHLLKDDFFATETYPTATFASTSIVSKGGNMYDISGDLTIKGVTKSITFTAEITDDYLTAQYDLPRAEFGIGNDTYGQKLLEPTVPVDIKLVFQS